MMEKVSTPPFKYLVRQNSEPQPGFDNQLKLQTPPFQDTYVSSVKFGNAKGRPDLRGDPDMKAQITRILEAKPGERRVEIERLWDLIGEKVAAFYED